MPFDVEPRREPGRHIVIDSFAGFGGASHGIAIALGRAPHYAINHDPEAIALHTVNHPATLHFCQDVWKVDPRDLVDDDEVIDLLWASPDCKHFSKAKGGKPVSKKVRGLAWSILRFAKLPPSQRPRVIGGENVEEFEDWGPLGDDDRPDPKRKGQTFKRWVRELRRLGYVVEWKQLRACDYGAPTIRKRLYIIARCDGLPIVWPEPTHASPAAEPDLFSSTKKPWRTAAECIDWSIPCPSIFERKKPLAEKTLARIARGLQRFVIDNPTPFLLPVTHAGDLRSHSVDEPMRTVTGAHRGEWAVVSPVIVKAKSNGWDRADSGAWSGDKPLPTVVASDLFAVVTPTLIAIDNQGSGDAPTWPVTDPLRTTTTENRFAVAVPMLIQTGYGERKGQAPRSMNIHEPLGTAVAGGVKHAKIVAFLAKHFGGNFAGPGVAMTEPTSTVTTVDHHALVTTNLVVLRNNCDGVDVEQPMPTVCAGGEHIAEVRAFLIKFYGATKDGQAVTDPLASVTTRDRFGLVVIDGTEYVITDIGMRMLTPRELARAQGFPDDFELATPVRLWNAKTRKHRWGPLSKTAQVRLIGNSVCPPVAAAIVGANVARRAA